MGSGIAFARQANARAVFDTGGNGNRQIAGLACLPAAATIRAGLGNDLSAALAAMTGALNGKKPLLRAHFAVPLAGRASAGLGARLGTRTAATLAGGGAGQIDLALGAVKGFLQADINLGAQIIAAPGAALPATTAAAAEKLFKNIAYIAKAGESAAHAALPAKAAHAAGAALFKSGMTELVISGARLLVFQHLIGFRYVFEFLLGSGIARIDIGVVFFCQFAIGRFQLGRIG